jgi:hypothetical protein
VFVFLHPSIHPVVCILISPPVSLFFYLPNICFFIIPSVCQSFCLSVLMFWEYINLALYILDCQKRNYYYSPSAKSQEHNKAFQTSSQPLVSYLEGYVQKFFWQSFLIYVLIASIIRQAYSKKVDKKFVRSS